MDFELMLTLHLNRLASYHDRRLRGLLTESEEAAAIRAERLAWLDFMTWTPENERGYTFKYACDLTAEQKAKFDTDPNFPLAGIMFYRQQEIPFYDDDPGQQVFAVYNGETLCAGAYNFQYLNYFAISVDRILDEQYLDELFKDGE